MRLERMTVCLEGRCSIQLSYRTILPSAVIHSDMCLLSALTTVIGFGCAKVDIFYRTYKYATHVFHNKCICNVQEMS